MIAVVVLSIAFLVITIAVYFINFHGPTSSNAADWGTFGDFIGGTLNPIFSLLALFALLATIALQNHEMELTRTELQRAAAAQERTQKELAEQAHTLKKQKFEDTFFSLLDQLNLVLNNLTEYKSNTKTNRIEDIVLYFFGFEGRKYSRHCITLSASKPDLLTKNQILNQYFRILYQILKFIAVNCDNTTLTGEFSSQSIMENNSSKNELFYSNIVRSFITEDLYYLLAINCYAASNNDQYMTYRRLIERFHFLEHINLINHATEDRGINKKLIHDIVDYYDKKAFGKNIYYQAAKKSADETRENRSYWDECSKIYPVDPVR